MNNNLEAVLLVIPLEKAAEEKTLQEFVQSLKNNLDLTSKNIGFKIRGEPPFKIGILPFDVQDVLLKKYGFFIKDSLEIYLSQSRVLQPLEREKIDLI